MRLLISKKTFLKFVCIKKYPIKTIGKNIHKKVNDENTIFDLTSQNLLLIQLF